MLSAKTKTHIQHCIQVGTRQAINEKLEVQPKWPNQSFQEQ